MRSCVGRTSRRFDRKFVFLLCDYKNHSTFLIRCINVTLISEGHGAVTVLQLGTNEEGIRVVTPALLLISNHIQFIQTIIFGECCLLGCDAMLFGIRT